MIDINLLAHKVGVAKNDILDILKAIGVSKLSLNDASSKANVPIQTIKKLRQEAPELFLPIPNFLVLSPKAHELLSNIPTEFNFTEARAEEIRSVLTSFSSQRPIPKREYDQFYTTPETQIKRIKLLSENHDLQNSEVIFLGDDDVTSVCLGLLGITKRIAVVDIDQRQLDFIEKVARSLKIKLELYLCDLREGLLSELTKKFDIIFTDPPYTPDGFSLFLQRGLESARGLVSTLYLCYSTSDRSLERLLPIQEELIKRALVLKQVFSDFNNYTGAYSIGDKSNLYVVSPTPKTPFKKPTKGKRIYTHE